MPQNSNRKRGVCTWRRSVLVLFLSGLHTRPAHALRQFRIGVLGVSDWDPTSPWVAPLVKELSRLGYVQGRNLVFIVRVCGANLNRLDDLAGELVALRVDAILSEGGTPSALAAKHATSTIPIVLHGARDPVADGLVHSLARPGGNVTGNADMGADLMVKRLSLLMEAIGDRGPVGYVVYQPHLNRESERRTIAGLEAFVRSKGVRLIVIPIREISPSEESDLENGFASLSRQGGVGALVNNYSTIGVEHERVAALMLRYRLPAIMEDRSYSLRGVLMTYTEPNSDPGLRAADYLDRILRGAKPADLPVAQATRFDLIVNLKTAEAMGIVLPSSLLVRADELIR